MEELALTTPVTTPATTTSKYHVVSLTLDLEAEVVTGTPPTAKVGAVSIKLRDNLNVASSYRYEGDLAISMIKTLNTANLTTKSMHKRVLERLSADGFLVGSVVGAPDP